MDRETCSFRSRQDEVHLRPASGVYSVADQNHPRNTVLGLALKDDIKTYQNMTSETRFRLKIPPTVVYGRDDIGLLVLRTPNQKFIVVGIKPCPYLVDKLAEVRSTRRLSNVQERHFPDPTANANLEGYQAQSILRGERRDNKVERSLDGTVFEIRGTGGDVQWGDGDNEDEDEVERRVNEGKEGVGGTTQESGRGEPELLDIRESGATRGLTAGKVSVTRGPRTEPGGRFPGNSMATIHAAAARR